MTIPPVRRVLAVLAALALLATACSGDDGPATVADPGADATAGADPAAEDPGATAASTTEPAADPTAAAPATPTTETPKPEPTTEEPTPTPTATDAAGDVALPVPSSHSAGAITLDATLCTLDGAEFVAESSSRVMPGIEVVGEQVYLTNADGQVLRFDHDTSAGCALTIDETWGTAGVETPAEEQEFLSASDDGILVASGSIFGSQVYDLDAGTTYECDAGGQVEIDRSGETGLAFFPGSELEEVSFDAAACEVTVSPLDGVLPYDLGATAVHFTGDAIVTGGSPPDTNAIVVAVGPDGAERWRQGRTGDDAFSADDAYGWVHDISGCGGDALCTLDTNFRALHVLSPDGTYQTTADLNDLHGVSSAWWESMASDDLGRLWMAVGEGRPEADLADGYVFLVTITGI